MKPKFPPFGSLSAFSVFAFTVSFASLGGAQDGSWISDGPPSPPNDNFNWSNSANWNGGVVPGGVGSTVTIGSNISAARTITLDGARTIGALSIGDTDNSHAFTLSGANILTFDNGVNPASITGAAGSIGQTISVPISLLSSSLNIVNSATSSTTTTRTLNIISNISAGSAGAKNIAVPGTIVSSPVTLAGTITDGAVDRTISITKTGNGTLTLSGISNTYSGGVTVGAGILNLNSATALGTGLLTINGEQSRRRQLPNPPLPQTMLSHGRGILVSEGARALTWEPARSLLPGTGRSPWPVREVLPLPR